MKKDPQKHRDLFEALSQLRTPEEYFLFFQDLCTPLELDTLADRWQVAKYLYREIPYRKIYEKTGTSTATVTRVARSLSFGQGYQMLLKRTQGKQL
jgi:TrpR-related protein YerC/YecD